MNSVCEKRNVSQPADWWAAFEQQAYQVEDMSLSQWIGECCKRALPNHVSEKLSERPLPTRPKKRKD